MDCCLQPPPPRYPAERLYFKHLIVERRLISITADCMANNPQRLKLAGVELVADDEFASAILILKP
jgi:hypothetical protein